MATVTKRVRGLLPVGVVDAYPSEFALANRRKYRNEPHNNGRGPDAEPHAINCAQCNAFIPDWTALEACWNCSSDNFLGQKF